MGKTQWVRGLDVLVLGPFSIWFGARATDMPTWARVGMIAYGASTMVYNAWNFVEQQQSVPSAGQPQLRVV
jgi:hypothetical protein